MTAAPGPYNIERDDTICARDGEPLAEMFHSNDGRTAALLAASWELREALHAVMPYLHHFACDSLASLPAPDCGCGLRARLTQASAALRKANGEVPPCD